MKEIFSQTNELVLHFILLAGDDILNRELTRKKIISLVKNKYPDATISRLDIQEETFDDFLQKILTPSLLSPVRIFLIPDIHLLSEKELFSISDLFNIEIPDSLIIMETEKAISKKDLKSAEISKKFLSWISIFEDFLEKNPSKFYIETFIKPPVYQMAEWIILNTNKHFGRKIQKQDAEYLLDLIGTDTFIIYSELQKIDLFLESSLPITKEIINEVCKASRNFEFYEIAQALGEKDLKRVFDIIESIYLANLYLPPYIAAIFKHFWNLFKVYNFIQKNPDIYKKYKTKYNNDAAIQIGIGSGIITKSQINRVFPVIIKPKLVEQSMSFDFYDYKRIFSLINDFDIGIKSGAYEDPKIAFQLFCYKILFDKTPNPVNL